MFTVSTSVNYQSEVVILSNSAICVVITAAVGKGVRVKFQPQTLEFLNISDPKAVLERTLRNFACLTPGDLIEIQYNKATYPILVRETTPPETINIVDCDLEVDFEAPPGYVEPTKPAAAQVKSPEAESVSSETKKAIETSQATSYRLDGKPLTAQQQAAIVTTAKQGKKRGVPDRNYSPGMLKFALHKRQKPESPKLH